MKSDLSLITMRWSEFQALHLAGCFSKARRRNFRYAIQHWFVRVPLLLVICLVRNAFWRPIRNLLMNEFLNFFHSVIRRYVIAKNLISNQPKIQCPPEKHAFSVFFDNHKGHFAKTPLAKRSQRGWLSTMTSSCHCSEVLPASRSCIGPRIC